MGNLSRRSFIAVAGASMLALAGCSVGDSSAIQEDVASEEETRTGTYEGISYALPDGWSESENDADGYMMLSKTGSMIQISAPVEYGSSTSESDIADVTALALSEGGYSVGTMRESELNCNTCFRGTILNESADLDGEIVIVFSRGKYWMVLAGNIGDMPDEETSKELGLILDSLSA